LGPTIEELRRAAARSLALLILGPTGSGKEVAARAYHAEARPRGPFVAVNVASLSDELFEAEFFGSVPGAFTGARTRLGAFRAAHGGVLFLDEVGSLSPRHFSTLQRALQEGEVRPVGSDRVERVDVLVVAATERPLPEWVREGRFEASLYNRLRQALVELPPLSARRADIPALAAALLARDRRLEADATALDVEVLEWLALQSWPHQVRQLRHVLLAASSPDRPIPTLIELTPALGAWNPTGGGRAEPSQASLLEALQRSAGNKSAAARALGIDRSTLYRRMRREASGRAGVPSES
jgi:transcriptional regulator with PAS, ATPase and Fis domain